MKVEYMLDKEVELVLAALMPANRLAMQVALHTGLRIGDVLALETRQIKRRFTVKEHKTGKSRSISLPQWLVDALAAQAGARWVFEGRSPETHRTRQAVWKDVKRAAKAFRLPQNVGTHSARKVYAVKLLQKYGDIERVRRVLNHKYATTTMVYAMADHLLEAKLQNRAQKRRRGLDKTGAGGV